MLATNHGHPPFDKLIAAELCWVIKLEITEVIQESLASIRLQLKQQYTAMTTNTMMEMMMMMMMPPPAHPHGPHNPADLATTCGECELEPRIDTSFKDNFETMNTYTTPTNGNTIDDDDNNANDTTNDTTNNSDHTADQQTIDHSVHQLINLHPGLHWG